MITEAGILALMAIAQVVLLALKVSGVITWHWLAVLAPIELVGLAIIGVMILIVWDGTHGNNPFQ